MGAKADTEVLSKLKTDLEAAKKELSQQLIKDSDGKDSLSVLQTVKEAGFKPKRQL